MKYYTLKAGWIQYKQDFQPYLVFSCGISMAGSQFGVKNMKVWIHPDLYPRIRLLLVVWWWGGIFSWHTLRPLVPLALFKYYSRPEHRCWTWPQCRIKAECKGGPTFYQQSGPREFSSCDDLQLTFTFVLTEECFPEDRVGVMCESSLRIVLKSHFLYKNP